MRVTDYIAEVRATAIRKKQEDLREYFDIDDATIDIEDFCREALFSEEVLIELVVNGEVIYALDEDWQYEDDMRIAIENLIKLIEKAGEYSNPNILTVHDWADLIQHIEKTYSSQWFIDESLEYEITDLKIDPEEYLIYYYMEMLGFTQEQYDAMMNAVLVFVGYYENDYHYKMIRNLLEEDEFVEHYDGGVSIFRIL